MNDCIEIKVKDLKEGQRFWYNSREVGKAVSGRIMRNGTMIWADGTTSIPISHMGPYETVYAKSIINTGDTMSELQDTLKQVEAKLEQNESDISALATSGHDLEVWIGQLKRQIADAEVTYSIGDRFKYSQHSKEKVMLGRVWLGEHDDRQMVSLVRLATGECWNGAVEVRDTHRITQNEIKSTLGSLVRYWNNQRGVIEQ
jgi:hypothetical protein